jgi:hypothetical protein
MLHGYVSALCHDWHYMWSQTLNYGYFEEQSMRNRRKSIASIDVAIPIVASSIVAVYQGRT